MQILLNLIVTKKCELKNTNPYFQNLKLTLIGERLCYHPYIRMLLRRTPWKIELILTNRLPSGRVGR